MRALEGDPPKEYIRKWLKVNKSKNIYNSGILKEEIKKIDVEIDNGLASDTTINRRMEVLNSIQHLDKIQAMDMAQKAKVKWAIEGDENSRYFHGIIEYKKKSLKQSSVLGDIVNEVQSAFISDRQILDGPFILNEVIQWCKSKKKQSLIFKVDFEKAYDSVRWDFLDDESLHLSFQSVVDVDLFKGINLSPLVNLSHMFYADDAVFVGQWCDDNINTLVQHWNDFFDLRDCGLICAKEQKLLQHMSRVQAWTGVDDNNKVYKSSTGLAGDILNEVRKLKVHFEAFYVLGIYALESNKDVTVCMKLNEPSIDNSFRRNIRGGIEQLQFKELTDLLLPIVLNTCFLQMVWCPLEGSGEISVASIQRLY
ncbi:hypothetical protein Tco_0841836 [Tanacetum coccineum]|uniref:Reverse transcriptase domain-containing protein n=1 Tax=Tanacetum coccineum TaxID=301880 RepID=A0ABQ5B352_9ASTR